MKYMCYRHLWGIGFYWWRYKITGREEVLTYLFIIHSMCEVPRHHLFILYCEIHSLLANSITSMLLFLTMSWLFSICIWSDIDFLAFVLPWYLLYNVNHTITHDAALSVNPGFQWLSNEGCYMIEVYALWWFGSGGFLEFKM